MAKPIKVSIIGDASKLNKAMGSAGTSVSKFAAGAVASAAVATAALAGIAVKIGGEFDSAYDGIRVGTGATGEDLEVLKGIMQDVATSVPTSMGDAGLAVADLNTKLGLTGDDLQNMAEQQINLARLTGGDLESQITATSRIFGDWGMATGEQSDALNRLYQVAQTTGIGVDQLATVATNFGAPMRALGFNFEDATALLGKFEKEGVNTEAIMAGMKIGLGKMAQAGEDPIDTFGRVTEEIANAGTMAEASAIGLEAFGSRASTDMVMAIREGRFELEDLNATMSTDTISAAAADTESFGEKWTMFKNQVLVKLEPVIMRIFNGLGGLVDQLQPLWAALEWGVVALMAGFQSGEEGGEGFLGTMQTIGAKVAYWWPIIQATISNTMTIIGGIISSVLDGVLGFWEEHGDAIMGVIDSFVAFIQDTIEMILKLWEDHGDVITEAVQGIWDGISSIISGVLDVVTGIFDTFAALFRGDWGALWNGIKKVFAGVWRALGGIVKGAFEVVKAVLRVAIDSVAGILKGIGTALGNVARDAWDKAWEIGKNIIQGIKDGVSGAVGMAADIGKSVGNAIIGFINNNVINKFNRGLEFRIEVFGRGVDINPPDIPNIPTFRAMGGPAMGPVMVGERGPELVHLPRGARVAPSHSIADGGAGGGVTVNVQTNADPWAIGQELAWALKTSGR